MSNRIKAKPERRAIVAAGRPRDLDGGEAAGQVNLYRCRAGHERYTINRDTGVTPSGMHCGASTSMPEDPTLTVPCHERAWSTWYVLPPHYLPSMVTHEWWLPTVEQALVWPDKPRREREEIAAHVARGGMMLATLTPQTADRWQVGVTALGGSGT